MHFSNKCTLSSLFLRLPALDPDLREDDGGDQDDASSNCTPESLTPAYVYVTAETKRFVCEVCRKDFVTTQALKRHQMTVHAPNLERIPCTVCDAKFTRIDGIKRHMRKLHPDVKLSTSTIYENHKSASKKNAEEDPKSKRDCLALDNSG